MSGLAPRSVLGRVAAQVPASCRHNLIVVGSLAAAYQLMAEDPAAVVQTKDIDCVLVPHIEAVRAGTEVAEALLVAGWRRRTQGAHARPGTSATPDADLPVIRLYPPDTTDWYVELLSVLASDDQRDRTFDRVVLRDGGHYAVASFRHLDVVAHRPLETVEGLPCARLAMLVLSNLLRNPSVRPERMLAGEEPGPKRSNKDLGRVLTIAELADRDAVAQWPQAWADAFDTYHGAHWPAAARQIGAGVRALLASEADLREALEISRRGLLASRPMTAAGFRIAGERLLVDAIESFEAIAQAR